MKTYFPLNISQIITERGFEKSHILSSKTMYKKKVVGNGLIYMHHLYYFLEKIICYPKLYSALGCHYGI